MHSFTQQLLRERQREEQNNNKRRMADIMSNMVDHRVVGELSFDNIYTLYAGLYGGYKDSCTVFVHPVMAGALSILTHMDRRYSADYSIGRDRLRIFGCEVEENAYLGKTLVYIGYWNEVFDRWKVKNHIAMHHYMANDEELPISHAMRVLQVPDEHEGDTYSFYERIQQKEHERHKEELHV